VLETASILKEWIHEHGHEQAERNTLDGATLESELANWAEEQGWRGPCALWLDSLRQAWNAAGVDDPKKAGQLLGEEMAYWLHGDERDARGELRESSSRAPGSESLLPWNGDPFVPGRRLPSRLDLAAHAAKEIEPGDGVLVTSWSETVALSLETAWRAGRRPKVLLGEGSPDLDGRRMARRLARSGIHVTMVYDSAVLGLVPRVDRVWLATEAVGAGVFLAHAGTRSLLEECARRDVPVRVLATSDKLVPGGALRLPAWSERERWLLWEDAPEGVSIESQMFEPVPIDLLELVGGFLTEFGPEAAATLHLRALRIETAPPCDADVSRRAGEDPREPHWILEPRA
jgi:hypothetical protein